MRVFLILWGFFITLFLYIKLGVLVILAICTITDKIDDCFHSVAAAFGEMVINGGGMLFLFWPFILFLLVYDIAYTIILIPFRICYIILY